MKRLTGKLVRERRREIARHLGVPTSALQFYAIVSRQLRECVGYRASLCGKFGERCRDRLSGYPRHCGVLLHYVERENLLGATTDAEFEARYYAKGLGVAHLFERAR